MNFLGDLKSKFSTIYKNTTGTADGDRLDINPDNKLDYDDLHHTLNILQDENKILKNKIRVLENSVFGAAENTESTKSQSSTASQFGKIFKELKSTFIFSQKGNMEETKTSLSEFKNFLSDNIMLYNGFDEDDVDYLNNVHVDDNDWENNKDIFVFKQKILERNYNEMLKNMVVSRELDNLLPKGMGENAFKAGNDVKYCRDSKDNIMNTDMKGAEAFEKNDKTNVIRGVSSNRKNLATSERNSELENILLKDTKIATTEKNITTPSPFDNKPQSSGSSSNNINNILPLQKEKSTEKLSKVPQNNFKGSDLLTGILTQEDEEEVDLKAVLQKNTTESINLANSTTQQTQNKTSSSGVVQTSTVTNGRGKISTAKVILNKPTITQEDGDELAKSLLSSK